MKKVTFRNAFVRLFTLLIAVVSFNSCIKELYCGEDSLANPSNPSAKTMLSFSFSKALNPALAGDISATINGTDVVLSVPFGTDISALKPSINFFGGSISPDPALPQDFSKAVTYTVTAKDGSKQVYTVKITVITPITKEITSFVIKNSLNPAMNWTDVTGVITDTNIAIELPAGTDVTALKPSVLQNGNTLNPANEVAKDFTNPQTYTVTAQDGTTKVYTVTATVRTADVYIAGYESNGTKDVAKYWKNGVATSLTDGTQNARARAIQVVGTDVYVAGYEFNGTKDVAKIWKNGVATSVTDGTQTADARAIQVVGTDVYVAGFERNGIVSVAKYWKNGIATTLGSGVVNSSGSGIAVDGSDVYVCGLESSVGKIWKNGVATSIAGATNMGNIVLNNGDVYATATIGGNAGYVKNGVTTTLSTAGGTSHSMLISGGDVYVAGTEGTNIFKLWKNGVATNITTGVNTIVYYDIAVSVVGSDVYVAFTEQISGVNAIKLWKNGTITNITDGTKSATSWMHGSLYIVR
jgi:hypothetical protein